MAFPDFYDMDGNPISADEFATAWSTEDRFLKRDTIYVGGRKVLISTIWLGIDHDFSLSGPPQIFETLIDSSDISDEYIWRYATKFAALEGHKRAVNMFRDPTGAPKWPDGL